MAAAGAIGTGSGGLPLHRLELPGTRAATLVVAFDAGSRSETAAENGIAHFLEHLVFQGCEKFRTVRDVNWTGETLGARINAYTSQDHVTFHITVRAERLLEAADLLTDFTARPLIDPEQLERERGVVIQEINRSSDQPATHADDLIAAAAFGDHSLGRPVLGTEEKLRSFTRDDVFAFRARCWTAAKGGAFLAGDLASVDETALGELLERFHKAADGGRDGTESAEPAASPAVLVEDRDSNQSHLRLGYRPRIDVSDADIRAALELCVSLLGGAMGSRLIDEIREQRGLAYSVRAYDYTAGDHALVQVSAGLESARCIEAYKRMREIVAELAVDGPTPEEIERARALLSGRRILAFENTAAVAQHAAHESIVYGEHPDTDAAILRLERVSGDLVREVAAALAVEPSVACVGPHSLDEFG